MVKLVGADALGALNAQAGQGANNEFTPFKSGTKLVVKVLGTADVMAFDSYGIFKQVNSFVAANPSDKSPTGYPRENLTPWDKAFQYHQDQSTEFGDHHSQEAYKFKPKRRFALGFFDLTSGEQIVVDLSKAQAQAVMETINKFEKRLGSMAFELEKAGQGTSTRVTLTPVMFPEEDLSDEQRKNLENAPEEFDVTKFDGILFELDETQMVEKLVEAGFDVTAIGYDVPNVVTKPAEEEAPEHQF